MNTTTTEISISVIKSSANVTGNGTGSITVVGANINGSTVPVHGMFVDLRINGTHVASGFTPVTFANLQLGVQYGVVVYWSDYYYIRYMNDSNTGVDLQRYDLVTLNSSFPHDTLVGAFQYVPPSQAAALNVLAEFPNGTLIGNASYFLKLNYILHGPGMWVTLTPPNTSEPFTGTFTGGSILPFILYNHENYTIGMAEGYCGEWYTGLANGTAPTVDIVWSHWLNGSTDVNRTVDLSGNVTYVAIYDQLYPANCPSNSTTTAISNSTVRPRVDSATPAFDLGIFVFLPGIFLIARLADRLGQPMILQRLRRRSLVLVSP
jgi:hypothetical protein